ncbi:MAG: hypothetical protein U0526_01740 [Candidatus Saccharibacteria bacterium]
MRSYQPIIPPYLTTAVFLAILACVAFVIVVLMIALTIEAISLRRSRDTIPSSSQPPRER